MTVSHLFKQLTRLVSTVNLEWVVDLAELLQPIHPKIKLQQLINLEMTIINNRIATPVKVICRPPSHRHLGTKTTNPTVRSSLLTLIRRDRASSRPLHHEWPNRRWRVKSQNRILKRRIKITCALCQISEPRSRRWLKNSVPKHNADRKNSRTSSLQKPRSTKPRKLLAN